MKTIKYFDIIKEIKPVYPNSKVEIGTLVSYRNEFYVLEPGISFGQFRLTPVIKDTSRADICTE